jgi:hypothetical protein
VTSRIPQIVLDLLFDRSLVTVMVLPPKDPDDDEEDEEDEREPEKEEQPAVIREPDEC